MKFFFKIVVIIIAIVLITNTGIININADTVDNAITNILNTVLPQHLLLINAWTDTNMSSGYVFYEDNTVTITYANFNIPIVNVPFNGEIQGTYTTEEIDNTNYVTLTYSVFNQQITKKYRYNIDNDILTLVDPENGNAWTYFAVSSLVDPNEITTN